MSLSTGLQRPGSHLCRLQKSLREPSSDLDALPSLQLLSELLGSRVGRSVSKAAINVLRSELLWHDRSKCKMGQLKWKGSKECSFTKVNKHH